MIFEKAARRKLRFAYKGQAAVEDLWDLKVEPLDLIYKKLRSQQKDESEESLLKPATVDTDLNLRVKIVERIVAVKMEEKETRLDRAKKIQQKRRITAILADKEDETLKGKSADELRKILADME